MRTSFEWIKSMVPGLTDDPKEYSDRMTMFGQKVEFYTDLSKDLEGIVIGQILSITPHQDSDHLSICQVDVGKDEPIQIVTGATNMKEQDKVPVVLDGGRVAGGHDGTKTEGGIKIKKGKLRGVESNGMMCSIEELGSSRDLFPDAPEEGLYILPADAPVGDDAVKYLGLDDKVIEYEITGNRVDCFSVLGIAREAACAFSLPFSPSPIKETGNGGNCADDISVTIENNDLCKRFVAREIRNVHIGPSPEWMQKRLRSQGIRPINNIVDITNYVMEEYGQPMHSYDYAQIAGKQIIVRTAKAGENFTTLDGASHELDPDVLLICDGEKPVGLAGIMGGENSMITDDVTTVLLEAATFDGTNIRKSAKRLGMRTEASGMFEKGLDPNNAILAMNRACALVEEIGAGEVVAGTVDVYKEERKPVTIPFEPERYNAFLGTDISTDEIASYFEAEELLVDREKKTVTIPTFRQDLLCFADLAEEVARFFGYDRIPVTAPKGEALSGGVSEEAEVIETARVSALKYGFSEAMCFSFESPKVYDKLLLSEDDERRNAIKIMNPLGEDYSIMRTQTVNSMLESLSLNSSRRNPDARLFEIGKIYIAKDLPLKELPDERKVLTLGFYGKGDFFDMKGVVLDFLESAGIKEDIVFEAKADHPFLHPGRKADIKLSEESLGFLGEVHPTVLSTYGIKEKAYIACIDLKKVLEKREPSLRYEAIGNFPASTRDLSLDVPKDITAGEIESVFKKYGTKNLENFSLFDIYEGEQVREGRKSMAYSLVFRASDRSLSDDDVNPAIEKILKGLSDIGVELRK